MREALYKEVENAARDYWDEYAFWDEADFIVPEITHDIWPRTNQWSYTKSSSACTIYWALNQLIRLFGIDLTLAESNNLWLEVVDYCTNNYWYTPWYGRSTPTAINAVVHRWNEIGAKRFNKEKVFYTRRDYQDEKIKEALSKWHLIGYTYNLNFGEDRKKGLVWRDSYPWAWGHRTNRQATKTTKPTWWAKEDTADCWVYDSYYWLTNQYLIRDRKKYINKWMLPASYLILPQSAMDKTVEEVKENIAETKAVNYVLWSLSTAWASVPEKYQEKFAALAKEMREDYPDARRLVDDEEKKQAVAVTDAMSYLYKWASEEEQKTYAELATKLRGKYDFK